MTNGINAGVSDAFPVGGRRPVALRTFFPAILPDSWRPPPSLLRAHLGFCFRLGGGRRHIERRQSGARPILLRLRAGSAGSWANAASAARTSTAADAATAHEKIRIAIRPQPVSLGRAGLPSAAPDGWLATPHVWETPYVCRFCRSTLLRRLRHSVLRSVAHKTRLRRVASPLGA